MTKEAQNCLLKTLEEPPEYATIILIASNENKLLNTIRSRCIKINFNKIDNELILKYIKENIADDITPNMLLFCDGSIGKALKIKEDKDNYLKIEELINNISANDLVHVLNNAEVLYKTKDMIYDLLEYINILLMQSRKMESVNCIKYVEEAKKRLMANSNYDMTIDNLLMKMWEEINVEK